MQPVRRDPGFWRPLAIASIIVNVLILCTGGAFMAAVGLGIFQMEQSAPEPDGTVTVSEGRVSAAEVEQAASEYLTAWGPVDDVTCEEITAAEEGATSLCTANDGDLPLRVVVRMTSSSGDVEFFEKY